MTPPLFGQPIEPGEPKYSPEFEAFWVMSTMRGSKLAAYKAWRNVPTRNGIIAALHVGMVVWQQSEQWQDETKQPHVSTWLNRRGWEEIVPKRGHVHTAMCREFGFCQERTTL